MASDLSKHAQTVYNALRLRTNASGLVEARRRLLGEWTQLEWPAISRALEELRKAGLLHRVEGNGRGNVYKVGEPVQRTPRLEQFTSEDWVGWYRSLVREAAQQAPVGPSRLISRRLAALLEEVESPYLLALVLEQLTLGPTAYARRVGYGVSLLTAGVVHNAVQWDMGGYDPPWAILYYRRFARDPEEAAYIQYWLDMWRDARSGVPGTAPGVTINGQVQTSWGVVCAMALGRLEKVVTRLQERWDEEGQLTPRYWRESQLPPTEITELTSQMLQEARR